MIADLPTMPMRAGTRHSVVETVLLSSNGGELRYRVRSAELAGGGHPDPGPGHKTQPLAGSSLAVSIDPLAPSPDRIDAAAVALHACRHLAYLYRTDRLVADRAAAAPDLWAVIAAYTPALAGRLA